MIAHPSGTITFLFTDIEGSTSLWERHPDAMRDALARHDALVRDALTRQGGHIFKTVGDAFCAAFASASDALQAAVAVQTDLLALADHPQVPIRVRIGLHTGEADEREGDYFGPAVNLVARLMSAGHGGQTLLSSATAELLRDALPPAIRLTDLGEHRLKDLLRSQRIHQVEAPGLGTHFPTLRTLDARPNNLPVQPNSLIGRTAEIAALHDLVRRADARLITLTGPGGTGKTRLSIALAAELLEQFDDGVFFAALAPVSDPALVPQTLADALGLKFEADDPLAAVIAHVQQRHMLLVLDNFEQIMPAADMVSALLKAAPRLTIIVTSREALRIYGEQEYPVPPLALPDPRARQTVETLSHYASVALFIQRAIAVKPDFAITNASAPAVAAICARLDGLPLAIELAASRIRLFTPDALLTRLNERLRTLTGGPRDLPARQQTLRGAIAWSYDLLTDEEKLVFARMGVFAGAWSLLAAEAVCPIPGSMLDVLESLANKSLIQIIPTEDDPRFTMLETLREFARDRLEASGEMETARAAHAAYYTSRARYHNFQATRLVAPELLAELDNLRAARVWLHDQPDGAEREMTLLSGLVELYYTTGRWREGLTAFSQAIARDHAGIDPVARAGAYRGLALIEARFGQVSEALAHGQIAHDLIMARGLHDIIAIKTVGAFAALLLEHDVPRSIGLMEASIEWGRAIGAPGVMLAILINLGIAYSFIGETERATAIKDEVIALARAVGSDEGLTYGLQHHARQMLMEMRYQEAYDAAVEGVACANRVGNLYLLFGLIAARGEAEIGLGWLEQAAATLGEMRHLAAEFATAVEQIDADRFAVLLLVERGEAHAALRALLDMAEAVRALQSDYLVQSWLYDAACALIRCDAFPDAARLIGAVLRIADSGNGDVRWPKFNASFDQRCDQLRDRIGAEPFAALTAEGAAWDAEAAFTIARAAVGRAIGASGAGAAQSPG